MEKKKIRFVTFALAKYGGIIPHIEAKFRAFKEMGHDVDIIVLEYKKGINENSYNKKLEELESGTFTTKNLKSQYGGYQKSKISGYWFNTYYGWLLKPYVNSIPVFDDNALEIWKDAVKDVDLIIWSFIPTKTSEAKNFNWWHKYLDLPKKTKQILSVHDAYYDLRNSWTTFVKKKIKFLECVHITSYNVCQNLDLPRLLNYDSRYIEDIKVIKKSKRPIDFFSAHIFKSMKRMESLVGAVPYLKGAKTWVAGSGIELYYLQSPFANPDKPRTKDKLKYIVNEKTDPDAKKGDIGKSLWQRAEENGMKYLGLIENAKVQKYQKRAKFSVDLSFSKHYAKYANTHLNGFIIEAMKNGSYPVLVDYRGCNYIENDFLFSELKAIWVPHDATLKQIGKILRKALKMSDEEYSVDLKHNYELMLKHFNAERNSKKLLKTAFSKKKIKKLEVGTLPDKLRADAEKAMTEFFGYTDLNLFD